MEKPVDRPKSKSLQPLRALVPFLRPYRVTLLLALLALVLAASALLVLPMALRQVIDQGMTSKDVSTINSYFLGFLGAAVVFGVFAALRFYLVTWLGERVVADVRGRYTDVWCTWTWPSLRSPRPVKCCRV